MKPFAWIWNRDGREDKIIDGKQAGDAKYS